MIEFLQVADVFGLVFIEDLSGNEHLYANRYDFPPPLLRDVPFAFVLLDLLFDHLLVFLLLRVLQLFI